MINPRQMLFHPSSRSFIMISPSLSWRSSLIWVNPKIRAILLWRVDHWWEAERWRRHDGRKWLRTIGHKFPSVSIRLVSAQHVCQPFQVNAQPLDNIIGTWHIWEIQYHYLSLDHCFYCLLKNLQYSSPTSKIAIMWVGLRHLETLHNMASSLPLWYPLTTALHWSFINLSSMTTSTITNRLCLSPTRSTISLSSTLSTTSSKEYPAHLDSPTPSIGIITVRLMALEPKKDCWQRIVHDWNA